MTSQSEEVADTGAGVADPAVDPSPHRIFTSAGLLVQPDVLQLSSLQQRARAHVRSRSWVAELSMFCLVVTPFRSLHSSNLVNSTAVTV